MRLVSEKLSLGLKLIHSMLFHGVGKDSIDSDDLNCIFNQI